MVRREPVLGSNVVNFNAAGAGLDEGPRYVCRARAGPKGVHHQHPGAELTIAKKEPFVVSRAALAPPTKHQHAGKLDNQHQPHLIMKS